MHTRYIKAVRPPPLKLGHYFQRLKGDVMARKRHSDEDILKLLREVCGERTRGPVFVFGINGCDCQYCTPVSKKTGNPHKKYNAGERITSIRTTFETARERIGRPDLRFHDLRHTPGTWLNSRGVDINVIKDVLGHRDITTTQRYLHVGIDVGRKALDDKLNFDLSAPRE